MPRNRILLISPFFFPEKISTGRYNTFVACALGERSSNLYVLCSHPLYPDWIPRASQTTIPQIAISRGGKWVRYPRNNVLRRLVLETWFACFVFKELWQHRLRIDVLIIVFPPVVAGRIASAILPKRVRKVGIVHDLIGVMAKSKDSLLRRFVARLMRSVEKRAFRCCDQLVCLSSSMRDVLSEDYGMETDRLKVFYPFATINRDELLQVPNLESLNPEKKNVVYSGALGEKQVPDLLFNVMGKLADQRPDVVCHIFSAGPIFERLKNSNGRSERLVFHGLVEEADLPSLYAGSYVQIIPQAIGTGGGAFPSKYPNLVAAGTPIFAICDRNSELDDLIQQTACAKSTDRRDVDGLVTELSEFIDTLSSSDSGYCRRRNEFLVDNAFNLDRLIEFLRNSTEE